MFAPEGDDRLPLGVARHALASAETDVLDEAVPLPERRERVLRERALCRRRAVRDEQRCRTRTLQRSGVGQQRAAHADDGAEGAWRGTAVCGARELGAPPAQRELGGEGPALREAEEVYAGDGPAAVGVQVLEDGSEQRERRRWVRVGQELAERVEGVIPLVRFFVEVRDPRKFCVESGFCG